MFNCVKKFDGFFFLGLLNRKKPGRKVVIRVKNFNSTTILAFGSEIKERLPDGV